MSNQFFKFEVYNGSQGQFGDLDVTLRKQSDSRGNMIYYPEAGGKHRYFWAYDPTRPKSAEQKRFDSWCTALNIHVQGLLQEEEITKLEARNKETIVKGVRWTHAQWQRVEELAAKHFMNPSQYIRAAALKLLK